MNFFPGTREGGVEKAGITLCNGGRLGCCAGVRGACVALGLAAGKFARLQQSGGSWSCQWSTLIGESSGDGSFSLRFSGHIWAPACWAQAHKGSYDWMLGCLIWSQGAILKRHNLQFPSVSRASFGGKGMYGIMQKHNNSGKLAERPVLGSFRRGELGLLRHIDYVPRR
ncbi:hypothetical protein LZ32DRAFT_377262 [Colletotrichum eremochloae]|nr:hypothetical protein LZ32DRAFT_377262 [Colletotrichum eremochloae]